MTQLPMMTDGIILEIEHFLPYRLTRLASFIAVNFANQYSKPMGLSIPEWRVVAILGSTSPLSSKDIAIRSNMDKAKVSRAISRLAAAGLIQRKNTSSDLRCHLIKLTSKGKYIHNKIVPIALSLEKDMVSVLSDEELAAFNQMLDRMYQHLLQRNSDATHEIPQQPKA